MNRVRESLLCTILCAATFQLAGCAADPKPPSISPAKTIAAQDDADSDVESDKEAWNTIVKVLQREGTLHDGVYTVVVPRDDLYVTVEEMYVPSAAGIESRFNFYHCTCGRTSVVGEFVLLDYEANDVIDALRAKDFTIASLAPFLLNSHPTLVCIHFKGEGPAEEVAQVIKNALSYTGKERDAPATQMAPMK
jgi:Domain of Unknown Function (DUF1259)